LVNDKIADLILGQRVREERSQEGKMKATEASFAEIGYFLAGGGGPVVESAGPGCNPVKVVAVKNLKLLTHAAGTHKRTILHPSDGLHFRKRLFKASRYFSRGEFFAVAGA
jgi:hypothetical protein